MSVFPSLCEKSEECERHPIDMPINKDILKFFLFVFLTLETSDKWVLCEIPSSDFVTRDFGLFSIVGNILLVSNTLLVKFTSLKEMFRCAIFLKMFIKTNLFQRRMFDCLIIFFFSVQINVWVTGCSIYGAVNLRSCECEISWMWGWCVPLIFCSDFWCWLGFLLCRTLHHHDHGPVSHQQIRTYLPHIICNCCIDHRYIRRAIYFEQLLLGNVLPLSLSSTDMFCESFIIMKFCIPLSFLIHWSLPIS